MRHLLLLVVFASFSLVGCASRKLPKYEKPMALTKVQTVRTTAYTHTESDHTPYGNKTAIGTTLRYGAVKSAAADWSRWPLGTMFRIRETGEIYEVDDIGWALSGRNTIDLYKPSRSAMNAWGVRTVTIEHIRWGDPDRAQAVLAKRSKFKHVRRMLDGFDDHYPAAPEDMNVPEETQVAQAGPDGARLVPFFNGNGG